MVLALDPAWKTHADYLAGLTSKYRSAVKNQILQPIEQAGLVARAYVPAGPLARTHARALPRRAREREPAAVHAASRLLRRARRDRRRARALHGPVRRPRRHARGAARLHGDAGRRRRGASHTTSGMRRTIRKACRCTCGCCTRASPTPSRSAHARCRSAAPRWSRRRGSARSRRRCRCGCAIASRCSTASCGSWSASRITRTRRRRIRSRRPEPRLSSRRMPPGQGENMRNCRRSRRASELADLSASAETPAHPLRRQTRNANRSLQLRRATVEVLESLAARAVHRGPATTAVEIRHGHPRICRWASSNAAFDGRATA